MTRATDSLFRGANLEKGPISDGMACTKEEGYCQMLIAARATANFCAKVRAATAGTFKIWCTVLLAES